ncbi:MAG: fused MFS/spermidine synthase [Planctomycetaceae bacterium]
MTTTFDKRWLGVCYAVTIFVSAFLLFQVQPLISKYILPWFGGTPAVWTTCMLFFQMVLFAGYAYAHVIVERLSPRAQAGTQLGLMLVALLTLPVTPNASWKPTGNEQPTVQIILLLGASVGLPFFILSSTGPLLQGWFSRTHPGISPYRLYALSNLGSLLALVSYPFVFEPAFATQLQANLWSIGFVAYAMGCGVCAVGMARRAGATNAFTAVSASATQTASAGEPVYSAGIDDRPSVSTCLLWFGLAMAASALLLATTNQVCMDVASVPFLWVLPLTLYLLSFILCFDSDRWYSRWAFTIATLGSMATVARVLNKGAGVDISVQALVYFSTLFFCAMFCHGELARLKPHPRYLTMFYLLISAGGAAGGLFVGVIAPYAFNEFYELPIAMVACVVLMLVIYWRELRSYLRRAPVTEDLGPLAVSLGWLMGLEFALGLSIFLIQESSGVNSKLTAISRNFYGVLRVKERGGYHEDVDDHRFTLTHGRILHGVQFTSDERRRFATTYYSPESGVGLVLENHHADRPKRVGVVGLGTGTVASYAQKGDVYRFYDINPQVIEMAKNHFTYLSDCEGDVETVLGDARLSMEHEEPQRYDVIVLDAFSSDAIPVHLLTVEAFEIYRKHLVDDGVLAVHISNRHFELRPVVEGLADRFEMAAVDIHYDPPEDEVFPGTDEDVLQRSASEWVLVSPSRSVLESPFIAESASSEPDERRIVWTDDRNNLFQVLRRGETLSKLMGWIRRLPHDVLYGSEDKSEDESDSTGSDDES